MPVYIFIADDHEVVRTAVASYLSRQPGIEVVGDIGQGGKPLITAVKEQCPDVLLLDADMPGHEVDVLDTINQIRALLPELRILVLTAHEQREYVIGLVRGGVAGYVLKGDSPQMLMRAIETVAAGGEWISPRVANLLVDQVRAEEPRPADLLSDRELEVLRAVARGLTNNKIAEELFITEQTVKNHVSSIFSKLDVNTRVEAVLYALRHGLVMPDDSL